MNNGRHDAWSADRRSGRTWWFVLVLIVLAGAGALGIWALATRPGTGQGTARPAGAVPGGDPKAAQAELEALQEQMTATFEAPNPTKGEALLVEARAVVERYPKYAPARTFYAQTLLYLSRFEEAYQQLVMSLSLDGQQPEVQMLAGTTAMQLDKVEQAAQHYSQAVGLQPQNPRYRLFLAQALLRLNQPERARDELLQTLRIDSSQHQAYATLSDIYAQQNRLDLAMSQIQKAIEHTPAAQRSMQLAYIRKKAVLLRRDNHPEQALALFKTLSSQERSEPANVEEMAVSFAMLGKPAMAAELYENALLARPTEWRLAAGAAQWRLKTGDKAAARRHVETLRRLNPRATVLAQLEEAVQ